MYCVKNGVPFSSVVSGAYVPSAKWNILVLTLLTRHVCLFIFIVLKGLHFALTAVNQREAHNSREQPFGGLCHLVALLVTGGCKIICRGYLILIIITPTYNTSEIIGGYTHLSLFML